MDALMQSGRVTLTIFTIFFKTAAFYMKSFDLTDKKKKKSDQMHWHIKQNINIK